MTIETKREYYDNGQLMWERSYKNRKLHGLRRGWYRNGQLEWEWNYENGQLRWG